MATNFKDFKKNVLEASEIISEKVPLTKTKFDDTSKSLFNSMKSSTGMLVDVLQKTKDYAQDTIDSEHVGKLLETAVTVKESTKGELIKYSEKVIDLVGNDKEKVELEAKAIEGESIQEVKSAIIELEGKDKIGVVGEGVAAVGGAAAGAVAAGSIASVAGASTLLGSTSLAGALGGVFITTTPIGWVVGSAIAAGAAGYGVSKMIRSGSEQDHIRKDIIIRLSGRLEALCSERSNEWSLDDFNRLLPEAIFNGLIDENQANKMLSLVESGSLDVGVAAKRLGMLISSLKVH